MNDFQKILEISEDKRVKVGLGLSAKIHTELALTQSRWVCRNGTLSDGFECFGAQRFFQANREMYHISRSIMNQKIRAMRCQADLLEAKKELDRSSSSIEEHDKLRIQARIIEAQSNLSDALTQAEDLLRPLDEYAKIREELREEVMLKYPEGLEQAEPDHWRAVATYRFIKSQTPGHSTQDMSSVPLPAAEKAQLGFEMNRSDMVAPLIITDEKTASELRDHYFKTKGLETGLGTKHSGPKLQEIK